MSYEIRELNEEDFPPLLFQTPDPPERLFIVGKMPGPESKFLCVVGSRKYSDYGKEVCERLIKSLQGQDVVIVSGLGLGIDTLAHEAALEAGLKTIAIPGSGLGESVIHPRRNLDLAKRIVESDGALLSEYEYDFIPTLWSFPRRNRIMAGMCEAALIIEGGEKSGTLITARLSMEYNREVLAVPQDIFSRNSFVPNNLIKDGATPIIGSDDVLEALGLKAEVATKKLFNDLNSDEKKILDTLVHTMTKDELIEKCGMDISKANILISGMEIKGVIKERYGKVIICN